MNAIRTDTGVSSDGGSHTRVVCPDGFCTVTNRGRSLLAVSFFFEPISCDS